LLGGWTNYKDQWPSSLRAVWLCALFYISDTAWLVLY
jgi:hypothetical protein